MALTVMAYDLKRAIKILGVQKMILAWPRPPPLFHHIRPSPQGFLPPGTLPE